MKSFSEHRLNPIGNSKPLFVSTSCSHVDNTGSIELFFDIQKDKIQGLYFKQKGHDNFVPWLSILCEKAKGLSMIEAKSLRLSSLLSEFESSEVSETSFFFLPLLVFHKGIDDYLGGVVSHAKISNANESELLCRCMGVYEGQIRKLVASDFDTSLNDLADKLHAAIGCGSCLSDIKEVLLRAKASYGKKTLVNPEATHDDQGKRVKILGMYSADLALKVDECLEQWRSNHKDETIEITRISGYVVGLRTNSTRKKSRISAEVEAIVSDLLGVELTFSFS